MSKKMCLIVVLSLMFAVILSGCEMASGIDADVTFSGETSASWLKCE